MNRSCLRLFFRVFFVTLFFLPACGSDNGEVWIDGLGPYSGMRPAGPTVDELLGIASHMSTEAPYDAAREFEIQRSVAAGVSRVRRGFYWPDIEPTDDVWTFDGYDVLVALLREKGLRPCALLTRAVKWAAPGGSPNEIDPANFADFTGTVAMRYSGEIDLYEIWNEQNSEMFWNGGPDPDRYGRLLKAAHAAIHAVDPRAEVIFGGLSPFDPHLFDPRGIWNFLARVGETHPDLCEFMDGVAIHPYTFLQQPGPELSLDFGIYRYPDLRGNIQDARSMLEELGCADKPIHLTEMGWFSSLIGLERQAAYLARGALLASAARAASFFWYTFYDEAPASSPFDVDFFGLYRMPDGVTDPEPKPSYQALLGLHKVVGGGRYAGNLGGGLGWEDDLYGLVFRADAGLWTVALWRAGTQFEQEVEVQVPLPGRATGAWTLFDQEGGLLSSGDTCGGVAAVTLSGRVRYLQFQTGANGQDVMKAPRGGSSP